jgi:hypothetical protein
MQKTATGQEYGAAKAQQDSMAVVPMATGAGQPPAPSGPAQMPPGFVPPDQTPTFGDPTARPDEPVTAGLPFGPGAGPGQAGPNAASDDIEDRLRALYAAFPTPELRELLEQID